MGAFTGKTIGVYGLGKAGRGAVDALLAAGAIVYAWDDKPESREGTKGTVVPVAEWPWEKIKTLVLSPGIPLTHPQPHEIVDIAKKAGAEIICDVEVLYRLAPDATYVGITGTNGKSTTTALIGHILKSVGKNVQVGGNIGIAATSLPLLGKGGIYVLELSSYQLDLVNTAHFHIAVFLNITPDHLDRHGDMEGYIRAKRHLFDRQRAGDKDIIAVDDDYTKQVARDLRGSEAEVIEVSADMPPEGITPTSFKRLPGRHNVQNMALAYNAALQLGVPHEEILEAIGTFSGLDHRLQLIAEKHGVAFINDSKATNAVATEQALNSFPDNIYWILGGLPKEGGIAELSGYFPRIKHAFLIGKAADEFARTLEGKVPYTQCGTLEKAFAEAATMAKKNGGGTVLLSPACASWDQFKSFEHRGQVFAELARKWA